MRRTIGERGRIGEDGLARRTNIARQDVGQSSTRHRTEIPALDERRNAAEPWHTEGIARDDDADYAGIGSSKCINKLVLMEVKIVGESIAALAVRKMVLVQTAHEDHEISLACLLDGFGSQLGINAVINGFDAAIEGTSRTIALGIVDGDLVAKTITDALQGRNLNLGLEFRRTSAHAEAACSVLAHNEDAAIALGTKRQQGSLTLTRSSRSGVLEEDDALVGNATSSGKLGVAGYTTIGIGSDGAGFGTEYQAKNTCSLVIDD